MTTISWRILAEGDSPEPAARCYMKAVRFPATRRVIRKLVRTYTIVRGYFRPNVKSAISYQPP